jgi:hypothetical protein
MGVTASYNVEAMDILKLLFILSAIILCSCLVQKVKNSHIVTHFANEICEADSLPQKLNQISPSFCENWKKDSLGCEQFRARTMYGQRHKVFKGYSYSCILEALGKPNENRVSNSGGCLTYILFGGSCDPAHGYKAICLGFNEQGECTFFALEIE